MLKMYCDGNLIWKAGSSDKSLQIEDPKIVDQFRRTPTLAFTLPKLNAGHGAIREHTSRVTLWEDGEIIFHGRPVSIEETFNLSCKVVCESALGFMGDPYVYMSSRINAPYPNNDRPIAYLIGYILNGYSGLSGYNYVCDPGNEILLGDTYEDDGTRIWIPSAREDKARSHLGLLWALSETRPFSAWMTWTEENGAIVSRFNFAAQSVLAAGGPPFVREQEVRFGVNLIDVNKRVDATGIFTKIRGYDTTNSVWFDYSEPAHVSAYGSITVGKDFDVSGYSDPVIGRKMEAEKYYAANAYPLLSWTIRAVDMVDLGVTDKDRLRVGFYNTIVSPPHGINERMMCQKIIRHLDQPGNSTYEFGQTRRTLTSRLVG